MDKARLDSGIVDINPYCGEKRPAQFYYIDLDAVTAGELTKDVIVSRAEAPSRAQRLLKVNDILFQTVRPYQQNNYFFCKERELRTVASTGYAQMRTDNNPLYIYYSLHQDEFVREVNNRSTGSSYPAINPSELGRCSIYFEPDRTLQDNIAAVLSAVEEAIGVSRALFEKYAAVKQGLMQDLLNKGKQMRLDSIVDIYGGSTPDSNNKAFYNGKHIWITPTDLSMLNSAYISTSERKLTDAGLKRATGKLYPANSVVMSCRAPVGYCAVVTEPFSFNQGCKALVCKSVNPLYLYYVISFSTSQLERFASGTTFLEIRKTDLEKFELVIEPDINKQSEIAEILTAADERLTAERERLRKLLDIKRGLMDDLLTGKVSTDKQQGGI